MKPKVLLHNISESALAFYDDNRKEMAQTMNQKLSHHFTMRINKRYFTNLKLSFGILVNISDSIIKRASILKDTYMSRSDMRAEWK